MAAALFRNPPVLSASSTTAACLTCRLLVSLEQQHDPELCNLDGMLGLPLSVFPLEQTLGEAQVRVGSVNP